MNYLPKRRKRQKMSHKEASVIRCAQHLQWVRGHECSVMVVGDGCSYHIQAAHVRIGTDGGTGMKPSDCWTIPLCSHHHAIQHMLGEETFARKYGIKMAEIAAALWTASPAGKRYRTNHTPSNEASQ